jgi:iron complex outermembrane receptor protein
VPTLVLPDAITVTRNTGKMESKGFEFELKALPVKGMEIAYNFGYTDAKFKKLKLPVNGNEIDLKGNRQIFTPQYTSMLAVHQTITLSERNSISLITRGEWMLIGKQYFDLANSFYQAPYDLVNLKVGLQYKHVNVMVWGRNLLNKKYISYGYDFGGMHFAEPRIFGITLGFLN